MVHPGPGAVRRVGGGSECLPGLYLFTGGSDSRHRMVAEPKSLFDLVLWNELPR